MSSLQDTAPILFSDQDWQSRKFFATALTDICQEEGIQLTFLSDYWLCRLEKGGRTVWISGLNFPLNHAAAAAMAADKVSTYQVLSQAGIPGVEHRLVRFPSEVLPAGVIRAALQDAAYPLVLKPVNRGGGTDVYKASSAQELERRLVELAQRYQAIALSPYEEIEDEFRVVMLDEKPCLTFRKVRGEATSEWRHNLRHGARPERVADGQHRTAIEALAQRAMAALQLRLAAVDVVVTRQGLKVMEVNAEFSLAKAATYSEFQAPVRHIYRRVVRACFGIPME